jgi:RNA polymerase sigma factor (sigma-70 family)
LWFALLPFFIADDYIIEMSEYELLQAFNQKRSEEAFTELVRRYAGLVYSVAKRRLADASLAQDITQIVFIRFAKTPPKVKNHAELAAWLHPTTLNVTIDTWRSETAQVTDNRSLLAYLPATNGSIFISSEKPALERRLVYEI